MIHQSGLAQPAPIFFCGSLFDVLMTESLCLTSGTGETSLLPFDCPVALDFFRRRLAENAFGEYDLQTFISSVGYFQNC